MICVDEIQLEAQKIGHSWPLRKPPFFAIFSNGPKQGTRMQTLAGQDFAKVIIKRYAVTLFWPRNPGQPAWAGT